MAMAGDSAFVADSVCSMSWICSGVKDATSAASTSGAICKGAVAGGTVLDEVDGWPAGANVEIGGAAETTGSAGTADGVAGGTSLPLFNIQIPTRRSEILVFGKLNSSKSSM